MQKKRVLRFTLLIFLLIGGAIFLALPTPFFKSKKHSSYPLQEKPFVVIIPSFNNALYCEQNILSVLTQNYTNFRVIFIDDASCDDTLLKVQAIVDRSSLKSKITLIHNEKNQGALKNFYDTILKCQDHEIITLVDGDDFLAHPNVLKKLNKLYNNPQTWMTYGNYLDYPSYKQNPTICEKFPLKIIKKNSFRQHKWVASHLKTFYAGLFKKIKKEDLLIQGQFLPMASDLAIMLPLLEMSGEHCLFVKEPLYLYNRLNPINDHKKNLQTQAECASYIRGRPSYERIENTPYFIQKEAL